MTTATSFPDDEPTRTESSDSVLVEFTDDAADFTPRPPRDAILRNLPTWLREAAARANLPARPTPSAELADCLLEQAHILLALHRHAEALAKVAEAERLYQDRGVPARVADCFRVAAEVHRALGDPEKALEYLRKEEDIRRRFAA